MSDPDQDGKEEPTAPARIRLAPSHNQKQRSKLKQPNESVPAPPPTPPPPAAQPEQTAMIPLRKLRLKRSGQAHDQLLPPAEGENPRKEDEY